MSGKVIVIEGAADGIGKSTQYNLLKEHLKKDGIEITSHHFPTYNTYQGEPVKKYLQGQFGKIDELSPYFINSLYALDRVLTWHESLKKKYENGTTILLDRYTTSSLIYQSALINDLKEKKEFIDYVCDFEYNKLGIPKPDSVIFLEAPFDLINKLRKNRKQNEGITNDIHETNLEFMKKVYENSIFLANYLNWDRIICNKQDQMKNIEDIHKEVYKVLTKKI